VHTDAVDLDLDQIVRFSLLSPKAGDVCGLNLPYALSS